MGKARPPKNDAERLAWQAKTIAGLKNRLHAQRGEIGRLHKLIDRHRHYVPAAVLRDGDVGPQATSGPIAEEGR